MREMEKGRTRGGRWVVAAACGVTVCWAAACASERHDAFAPVRAVPSAVVNGVTGVTCDVDITINASVDSPDVQTSNASTYNLHITGSRSSTSQSVTATIDQSPGVTLNLLTASLSGPIAYQSSGTGSPAAPDVSSWRPPTQATVDSIAQAPLDAFCNVYSGPQMSAGAVGTQGSSVQSVTYSSSIVATTTSDAATGLLMEEVISANGDVQRDTRYTYASTSDGMLFRSGMTITQPYVIEGQPVNTTMQVVTRNVTRTFGG